MFLTLSLASASFLAWSCATYFCRCCRPRVTAWILVAASSMRFSCAARSFPRRSRTLAPRKVACGRSRHEYHPEFRSHRPSTFRQKHYKICQFEQRSKEELSQPRRWSPCKTRKPHARAINQSIGGVNENKRLPRGAGRDKASKQSSGECCRPCC